YSPQKGLSAFSFSKFNHGEETYKGYAALSLEKIKALGLDSKSYHDGQIVAVDENGRVDPNVKVYDFSLTRNVVQMCIALILLTWIMLSVAKRYKQGEGVNTAPKGMQSLLEPVILFVQDEVAKPNLGAKY